MIEEFKREFERWQHDSEYPLKGALAEIDRADELSRLIGFAYIHLAYDLPRVIARLLPKFVHYSAEFDLIDKAPVDEAVKVTEATRLNEVWRAFIGADSKLVQTFSEQILVRGVLPHRWWFIARTAPMELRAVPGLWVVVQRHEAWHNGEKLACSQGRDNAILQLSLRDQIQSEVHACFAVVSRSPSVREAVSLLSRLSPPLLSSVSKIPEPPGVVREAGDHLTPL